MDLILTFHSIDDGGSVLSYPPTELERLLEGLLEEGARFVDLETLRGPRSDHRPRVLITFDDGFESVHARALPVLQRLGIPALLYVVTEWVGRDNRWPGQGDAAPVFDLLSWDALRELADSGFELGSHTANHARLTSVSPAEREVELTASKARLEDELQREVRHFAYPYGSYRPSDPEAVAAHYSTATTTDMRFLKPSDDAYRLPRVDAYYLQNAARRLPVFSPRTRSYLFARALLRNVRARLSG